MVMSFRRVPESVFNYTTQLDSGSEMSTGFTSAKDFRSYEVVIKSDQPGVLVVECRDMIREEGEQISVSCPQQTEIHLVNPNSQKWIKFTYTNTGTAATTHLSIIIIMSARFGSTFRRITRISI